MFVSTLNMGQISHVCMCGLIWVVYLHLPFPRVMTLGDTILIQVSQLTLTVRIKQFFYIPQRLVYLF
jgi:hypothetical protein